MYLITENGEKLPVDNSSIDYEKGWHPWYQTVAVIDDDTAHLEDVYIVSLHRKSSSNSFESFNIEWFKDIYFDHKPSNDEIMAAIIRSGGGMNTIAFVDHGYMIDIDYE